jgi:predicted RNA polymerase sigma factor
LQGEDAMILKFRADVRGKLGRREEAIKDYKRAIEIQSKQ